jgi:hypothetical protein
MHIRHLLIAAIAAAVAACVSAEEDPAVAMARSDLATRLQVRPEAVNVIERTEKTWPNGSLGCPQPGMQYTQSLVEGSLLVLEVQGDRYNYHAGGGRDYFLCAKLRVAPGGITRGADVEPTQGK